MQVRLLIIKILVTIIVLSNPVFLIQILMMWFGIGPGYDYQATYDAFYEARKGQYRDGNVGGKVHYFRRKGLKGKMVELYNSNPGNARP